MLTCCPTTCESGIHPGNNYYKRVGLFSTLSTIPRSCYGGHGNSLFYLDKQPTSWGRLSVPGPRRIQNPVMVFFVIPTVQAAGRSRLLRPGQANFVFWGRLQQGGHVCPESLREFMVSFWLTYRNISLTFSINVIGLREHVFNFQ